MGPHHAWLTKVRVDGAAPDINFDLAIAASGGAPSMVDAGFQPYGPAPAPWATPRTWIILALAVGAPLLAAWFAATIVSRRATPPPAGA